MHCSCCSWMVSYSSSLWRKLCGQTEGSSQSSQSYLLTRKSSEYVTWQDSVGRCAQISWCCIFLPNISNILSNKFRWHSNPFIGCILDSPSIHCYFPTLEFFFRWYFSLLHSSLFLGSIFLLASLLSWDVSPKRVVVRQLSAPGISMFHLAF